jgi:hypothetical protein
MRGREFVGRWLAVGVLAGSAVGCGGGGQGRTTAAVPTTNEGLALMEVGRSYQAFVKMSRRPPSGLKEVLPSEQGYPAGINALRKGDVIVLWGAGLDRTSQGAATILAYEKKTPKEGGLALMQDISIRSMTADEFQTAPKAPGKAEGVKN